MKNYHIVVRYRRTKPFTGMQHLCGQATSLYTLCGVRLHQEPADCPPDSVAATVVTWNDLRQRRDICQRCVHRVYYDLPPAARAPSGRRRARGRH